MVVAGTNASTSMFRRGSDLVGSEADVADPSGRERSDDFFEFPCSALLGSISGALYHQGHKAAMVSKVARKDGIGRPLFVIPNEVHALQEDKAQPPMADHAACSKLSQFTPCGG